MENEDDWIRGRWWRVTGPDGKLWCETSDEEEARECMRAGDILEKLWVKTEYKWEKVD